MKKISTLFLVAVTCMSIRTFGAARPMRPAEELQRNMIVAIFAQDYNQLYQILCTNPFAENIGIPDNDQGILKEIPLLQYLNKHYPLGGSLRDAVFASRAFHNTPRR